MAVLGISTNTRLVGFAILSDNTLVEYGTHLHKSPWSPAKAEQMIASLEPCVRQYCVKTVVLSIPASHHQTEENQYLITALHSFFTAQNIAVHMKIPEDIASLCDNGKKLRKKLLMEVLVQRFPVLHRYHQKELRNRRRYYFKLFEAVAVAVLAREI